MFPSWTAVYQQNNPQGQFNLQVLIRPVDLIKIRMIPTPTPTLNSSLFLLLDVCVSSLCPSPDHVYYSYRRSRHPLQRFAAYSGAARCDLTRTSRGALRYLSTNRLC